MGLQDDCFDCAAALKGTPEEEAFDNVYTSLGEFERRMIAAEGALAAVRTAAKVVGTLVGLKTEDFSPTDDGAVARAMDRIEKEANG